MATAILSTAGAVLGAPFGPLGSMLGRAAGGLIGGAIDWQLFAPNEDVTGPRLGDVPIVSAEEGAPIPRAYGTVRTGGQLIWATRFEEERNEEERQGGKGGRSATVTTFSYYGNAAYALCEGPISGVRRVWADGQELDLTEIEMRVHRGTDTQAPDPLIALKQGGSVPAFRGTAYVMFERLPLERFGNRLPQLSFEVLRTVNEVARRTRAITIIPGATEFGYRPNVVREELQPGETRLLNRHVRHARSDWTAAIDELQALCPNLEAVSLVVAWFGDDLDAARCRIVPGVESRRRGRISEGWRVAGRTRATARLVSRNGGTAAYGGTPDDASVTSAIRDLRARGLKVFLYPFVLMDVPQGNGLSDPYGGAEQAPYPWRGRITSNPEPEREGTPNGSAGVRGVVKAFVGSGTRANYAAFIEHYARLCSAAGGVDGFVIGSEMRGLTALRDDEDRFPFVDALRSIASDTKRILGPNAIVTYAADWTEYSGVRSLDGSGDLFRHLDPLWADPAIGAVGIDNYLPLSDFRDEDARDGGPDGATSPYDGAALRKAVEGGELFDWFYASAEDRAARIRTPITDGANGKPWAYRIKDIASWWTNQHHDRRGGKEVGDPTPWVSRSKPIWFTELGAPAVDKAANQPNVFPDPKSSENAVPFFSNGGRDDHAQHSFLRAHLEHWDARESGMPGMVDPSRIFLWTWDARPVPAFPLQRTVWADGENWSRGHWLNGRFSGAPLGETIAAVLRDHGITDFDTSRVEGWADGFLLTDPASARSSIASLMDIHSVTVSERDGTLVFRQADRLILPVQDVETVAALEDEPEVVRQRERAHDAPTEIVLGYRDAFRDHGPATAEERVPAEPLERRLPLASPLTLSGAEAARTASALLRSSWDRREGIELTLPWANIELSVGDTVRWAETGELATVERIEDGLARRATLRTVSPRASAAVDPALPEAPGDVLEQGAPRLVALDLPLLPERESGAFLAAWAKPWRLQAAFKRIDNAGLRSLGLIERPAIMGTLLEPLRTGPVGPIDRGNTLLVRLASGALSGVSLLAMLDGANALAVRCRAGWEVLQFQNAEEIEPNVWRLAVLLRARLGTDPAMRSGAEAGAEVVVLNDALFPVPTSTEIGREEEWIAGPTSVPFDTERFSSVSAALGEAALRPPAPVHLRMERRPDGTLALRWIRRGRVRADSWSGEDIPLGEESEHYRVRVEAGGRLEVFETTEPSLTLAPARSSQTLRIEVAQLAAGFGEGDAASIVI